MVRSRYHSPASDESPPRSPVARPSRRWRICLIIAVCGSFCTAFITSLGMFYKSPTGIVPQLLAGQIFPSSADTFVRIAENVDIDGPFDYRALAALCKSTTWREGLVFRLADTTGGGLGNVKVTFLNSLRFAIEAGASGYVMPRVFHRDPCDVKVTHTGEVRDFSYLFDRAYFKGSLKAACPMMTIYDDIEDLEQYAWAADSKHISPNSLDDTVHGYWIVHPYEWRSRFDAWLEAQAATPSADQPVLITLDHAFLFWPILSDSPALVRTFGRVLRSPPRMRRLAASVLHALSTKYDLSIDPNVGLTASTYFGVHLRTAADAAAVGWAGYDQQAAACLEAASAANFSIIYPASGDPDHVTQLTRDAMELHGIVVTTKSELLHGEDLEELRAMSWDQQALVDYEIMLKSSQFSGLQPSSFSYSVAVKRHTNLMSHGLAQWWTDDELDTVQRPWWNEKGSTSRSNPNPHDSLSTLLGDPPAGFLFESTIWP